MTIQDKKKAKQRKRTQEKDSGEENAAKYKSRCKGRIRLCQGLAEMQAALI